MTIRGVDYAWGRPDPARLAGAGYTFAVRYLSYDTTGKNLTLAEANALKTAGLTIVSNWEYAPTAALNGYNQGVRDATAAAAQHLACGGPVDRPIYFSVDFNAAEDELHGPVIDYFRGAATVLGLSRVGAYGGLPTIDYLFSQIAIAWGWQTYAWSSGIWHPGAQLRQVTNDAQVAGVSVDIDEAQTSDYGQWPTTPIGPHPTAPLLVDGILGPLTTSMWQSKMDTLVDGVITQPPGRSQLVAAVQRHLNSAIGAGLDVDGVGICQNGHTRYLTTGALQRYLGTPEDLFLSLPSSQCVAALQRRLNAGAF